MCLAYFSPQGALSPVKGDGRAWRTRGTDKASLASRTTLGICSNLAFWTLGIDLIKVKFITRGLREFIISSISLASNVKLIDDLDVRSNALRAGMAPSAASESVQVS